MSEQEPEVQFAFKIRESGVAAAEIRQFALGFQPVVIIEPDEEDGVITFNVDSTDLGYEGLYWLFGAMAETLKDYLEEE